MGLHGEGWSYSFEAIGTHWQIDIYQAGDETEKEKLGEAILARIEEFDKSYSRFRLDSLVSQMAQKAGAYTLPADAKPLLDLYQELYLLTEGKCTPLIGKALVEAGYDSSYTLKSRVMQPVPAWNEMMEYNFPSLILKCPVLLDFGAAGKGYLVDIIAELLLSRGIFSFCIDASGDIRCQGLDTALRIGLEHPENESQVIGVMRLVNGSLCGSAGNRRAWKGWNHIIDPDKLVSPTEIIATWVTARTAMEADGLATCLFFMPASSLHTAKQFESLVLYADYSYDMTKGFPAELFLT